MKPITPHPSPVIRELHSQLQPLLSPLAPQGDQSESQVCELLAETIADSVAALYGGIRERAIRRWLEADAEAKRAAATVIAERKIARRESLGLAFLSYAVGAEGVEIHDLNGSERELPADVDALVHRAQDLWNKIPPPRSGADFLQALHRRNPRGNPKRKGSRE